MVRDFAGASFGEQLRRERERRGLGVEAMCAATKVPVRHILALEAGEFAELPGGVFRRGFLRSYLSTLGLEESPWMERFEESCRTSGVKDPTDSAWTTFAKNVKNSRSKARRRNRSAWLWSWAILILLLAGLALTAILIARHRHVSLGHLWTPVRPWVARRISR